MELPIPNKEINYIKTKLLSNKSIGVRGWKVKDEKELLFVLDSESNLEENKERHIIDFLCKCSDNQLEFSKLPKTDIQKFALEARKLAKGEAIEYNYKCPHCSMISFDELRLTGAEISKSFDNSPAEINKELTVVFKDLSYLKEEELNIKFKDSPGKLKYYSMLNSIEGITVNGVTYTDLEESNVEEFLDTYDSDDMAKIYEEFKKRTATFDINHKVTCLQCGKEISMSYGNLLSFLVF